MAFFFHPDKELDLYRYYEIANSAYFNMSFLDYIKEQFFTEFDFFYGLSFLLIKKIGLPIEIINSFYVTIYYWIICKIILLYISLSSIEFERKFYIDYVIILIFFVCQPVLIFSISRQLAAIDIFYIGLFYYLKKQYIKAYLWIFLSMFFHVGMFIFVVVFILSYIISKWSAFFNSKYYSIYILLAVIFVSTINYSNIINFISNLNILPIRYQMTYAQNTIAKTNSLSLDQYMQIIILYINLVSIRKDRLLSSLGFLILLLLCFFKANMFFLMQRVFMFLPVFQGMFMINYFYQNLGNKYKSHFYILITFIAFLFSILNVYYYRRVFF